MQKQYTEMYAAGERKGEEDQMESINFELAALLDRSIFDSGEPPVQSGMVGLGGKPIIIGYPTPEMQKGPGGILWLKSGSQIVSLSKEGEAKIFTTGIRGNVASMAPTGDGGLLVLMWDQTSRTLIRFSPGGDKIWSNSSLPSIPFQKRTAFLTLISDTTGNFILYARDNKGGLGMNIDLDTGQLSPIFKLTEKMPAEPGEIWLNRNTLYWTAYWDEKQHWHRLAIDSKEQQYITPSTELQHPLGTACSPLNDHGALLHSLKDNALVWMTPEGKEKKRVIFNKIYISDGHLIINTMTHGVSGTNQVDVKQGIKMSKPQEEGIMGGLIEQSEIPFPLRMGIVEKEGSILLIGSNSQNIFILRFFNS